MLRIFRINDPYRLILVFLIILAYKLPIILSSNLVTIPELKYLLIGEKLANGAGLYSGLWDNTAPFAAWFYMVINFIFGKSLVAHQVISVFFLIVQAGTFNIILIRRKVFNENTYTSAFFYGLFGMLFFDVSALSPELMGLTFVLFSFDSLFSHLELRRKNDINLINLGIYIGIAAMFYLPYFTYFISITLGLLLFTNTIKRRYFLMFFGFFFVFLLLWTYYFLNDSHLLLFQCLIEPLLIIDYKNFFSLNSILVITLVPLFYLVMAIFMTFQAHGFSNFQVRIQSLFFLFLIFQIISWLLWSQKSGSSLIVFAPIFAFYFTHFFLLVRKRIWREAHFYILTGSIVFIFLTPLLNIQFLKNKINIDRLLLKRIDSWQVSDQKILVIGEDLNYYYGNELATPYLNWSISKSLLLNVNDYNNIIILYNAFEKDLPDFVIDEKNVFPEIIKRIPDIRVKYKRINENIYQKISN